MDKIADEEGHAMAAIGGGVRIEGSVFMGKAGVDGSDDGMTEENSFLGRGEVGFPDFASIADHVVFYQLLIARERIFGFRGLNAKTVRPKVLDGNLALC